jgi:hypothetical protein
VTLGLAVALAGCELAFFFENADDVGVARGHNPGTKRRVGSDLKKNQSAPHM